MKEVKEERTVRRRERERKGSEKFRFSLRSMEIGSSVFVGAIDNVHLCDESYVWALKSRNLNASFGFSGSRKFRV